MAADSISGVVRVWHREQGWGVLDSPATPGGCWAHFSMIQPAGFGELRDRERVDFSYERPGQDGFAYRAVHIHRAQPAGHTGDAVPPDAVPGTTATGTALWLALDD